MTHRFFRRAAFGLLTLSVALATCRVSAQGIARVRAGATTAVDSSWTHQVDPDSLYFAEGIDVDPRSGALYVTSIHYGTVRRLDRDGRWRDVLARSSSPLPAVYGVAVDTARDVLWLTTGPHARRAAPERGEAMRDSSWTETALYRVGLADGVVQRRWTLGPSPALPGEIALGSGGDVFVSDGMRGLLYRVHPETGQLDVLRDPALRSPQGIALADDGRVAWVADWSRGLLRWDLTTNVFTPMPGPDGLLLRGLDGLRRQGAWLIAVQNGAVPPRVITARLGAAGTSIEELRVVERAPAGLGEPTVGVVHGMDFVYVVSSQWPFWSDTGARQGSAPLPAVTLRHVPLSAIWQRPP